MGFDMIELQTQNDIPPTDTKNTACGFEDDDIRELGDRIANLSLIGANELKEYLRQKC